MTQAPTPTIASASSEWSTALPTEPGQYETRWSHRHQRNPDRVIVTRKGRGLSVYCPAYNDRVGMRELAGDGLEWRRVGP